MKEGKHSGMNVSGYEAGKLQAEGRDAEHSGNNLNICPTENKEQHASKARREE